MKAITTTDISKKINKMNIGRSTWAKAVKADALDLVENIVDALDCGYIDVVPEDGPRLRALLLNGASDWKQYSWGGCALCYNHQLREHYLTPSERERYTGDTVRGSHLLDIQASALSQACDIVCVAVRALIAERDEDERRQAARKAMREAAIVA